MWDLPRPGLEPVSPALAGRLSTTAPPGKPFFFFFLKQVNLKKNFISTNDMENGKNHEGSMELTEISEAVF